MSNLIWILVLLGLTSSTYGEPLGKLLLLNWCAHEQQVEMEFVQEIPDWNYAIISTTRGDPSERWIHPNYAFLNVCDTDGFAKILISPAIDMGYFVLTEHPERIRVSIDIVTLQEALVARDNAAPLMIRATVSIQCFYFVGRDARQRIYGELTSIPFTFRIDSESSAITLIESGVPEGGIKKD